MKKILLVGFAAAALMVSCNGSHKADMKNDVDTLSYEFGLLTGEDARNGLPQAGYDSTMFENFLKGYEEGLTLDDSAKQAYYIGIMMAVQNKMQIKGLEEHLFGVDSVNVDKKKVSLKNYFAGTAAGLLGKSELKVGDVTLQGNVLVGPDFQKRIGQIRSKMFEKNREEGKKFLDENGKKTGVTTTESGLQYKVLSQGGSTQMLKDGELANIYYEGRLINGNIFDSNYDRTEPVSLDPAQVVPGFAEALKLMTVGSEWEIYLPYELGYGENGTQGIDPCSTLIFKVKLVSTKAKPVANTPSFQFQ